MEAAGKRPARPGSLIGRAAGWRPTLDADNPGRVRPNDQPHPPVAKYPPGLDGRRPHGE
jgi:hypothetical protein